MLRNVRVRRRGRQRAASEGHPPTQSFIMRHIVLALAVVATLAACTESPTQTAQAPLFATVAGPAQIEGEIGPGALYALSIPADWNGDLVLYAHGYTSPAAPIALPDGGLELLRDALLNLGYGVAWSSFSENGYAVKDGVTRTRQLRGLFASNFGMPDRTYLMGHSLGGIVALMAAEKHPDLFDGALSMCSLVGGGPLEIDYIYDVRVLFDYFYPGLLPGDALDVPEGLDFDAIAPSVFFTILGNPGPALEMAAVDQIALPFTNGLQLANSILSALYFNVVGTADFFDRTQGGFFENSTTVYTGSSDDDALNAGVDRFQATPSGRNYLETWSLPKGDLKLPVLTLHTTMDPIVPFFHEPAYADIVAAAGDSDQLVQRSIDRYGHCAFTPGEQLTAFLDLVNWAENDVTPTP